MPPAGAAAVPPPGVSSLQSGVPSGAAAPPLAGALAADPVPPVAGAAPPYPASPPLPVGPTCAAIAWAISLASAGLGAEAVGAPPDGAAGAAASPYPLVSGPLPVGP